MIELLVNYYKCPTYSSVARYFAVLRQYLGTIVLEMVYPVTCVYQRLGYYIVSGSLEKTICTNPFSPASVVNIIYVIL